MLGKLAPIVLCVSAVVCQSSNAWSAETVEFNRDIRSILSNRCFNCHGPDSVTREAGLRLDRRESATGEADSGERAIVPGDMEQSELLRRVVATDDTRMPPEGSGDPLSEQEIKLLSDWIQQGAAYQEHWAFIPPSKPQVPADPLGKAANPIDHFVLAKLHDQDLHPAPQADRETLIRRVAFALTGLPPTPAEIDRYVADKSDDAYLQMVNRYFDSPAYGEHMSRHWLDLARYADSNGYQYDTERQQWVWRDWVINAYNQNMPFDQFTLEQLAGDLIPDSQPQQRLATGFNRNHGITIEGGIISEEYRTEYVMDRVVTTGQVWLGLTMGCARCHDHKYDPISQKEFYQVYAFFNQVPERGNSGFDPREVIPSPLDQSDALTEQIELYKKRLADPAEIEPAFQKWVRELSGSTAKPWGILKPESFTSSGGATLTLQDDQSLLVSGANPNQDTYEIVATTDQLEVTAVRLQALTDPSLPGGGPGRHSNSNFVLTEFELEASSVSDPKQTQTIKFARAFADYSQKSYEIAKAIDGVGGNSGWAVDGPSRKENATAVFVAQKPFGYEGGTRLTFRLKHLANFATHGVGRPRLSLTTEAADRVSLEGLPQQILELAKLDDQQRTKQQTQQLRDYFVTSGNPLKPLKEKLAKLESELERRVPATMVMKDMPKPRKTHVLDRGQYDQPKEEVPANTPDVFPAMDESMSGNRLGFAQWLTSSQHPLTARVAVNRYWQRLFGIGLVKTSEDFGVQGDLPSHPELLDWLAAEFIDSGWDVQHIQRLMLTSATFKQSAKIADKGAVKDPENRLLARGPRMRLDGEEVRDMVLQASGLLVNHIGGPSVYPYQPAGLWLELNNRPGYSKAYPQGAGEDLYRRSLYTFWKRTVPSPMMTTFDAPQREFCTSRRSRTNTPLQALMLLNAPQFVEAARYLGQAMIQHGGQEIDQQITYAFRLLTSRQPSDAELAILREAYQEQLAAGEGSKTALINLAVGDSEVSSEVPGNQLAAATEVARLIMNLSEVITK